MPYSDTMRVRFRAKGEMACFTRPELKVERVSYPVMTPSAARGIVEAVMWKPAIRWRICRIAVLKPIVFTAIRRNEVNSRALTPTREMIASGGALRNYFADEDRAQRNTIALRDVDYLVEARFGMTERAGSEDNPRKFAEMFQRRLEKGQYFHHPYLGCREFAAEVGPADEHLMPIESDQDLGLMLWDIEFGSKNRPLFFQAELKGGVLEVPDAPLGGEA